MNFKDKSILITGGTGSFGKAFAKYLLQEDVCRKVIIFSRDEWKQWEMKQLDPIYEHEKIRYFLGDVRDAQRLKIAFRDVDCIVHAAALKQVPAAEYNPHEFIKTNIEGAMNVIDCAIDQKVEKVVALSTDKAVNPVNLYGATKLCSDKLFIASNSYVGEQKNPVFSVVRYGNVLGTRGSLIPFWLSLVAGGSKTLPVTDERMTRFWITLPQACRFVLSCLDRMKGAEIFVPKIPSMKIIDMAKAVASQCKVEVKGIREGEKLHELLISAEEAKYTFDLDDKYVILPPVHKKNLSTRKEAIEGEGSKVPEGFLYSSETNPKTLSESELRRVLKNEVF